MSFDDDARRYNSPSTRKEGGDFIILMLFMLSGIAALLYQVCWQRSLFSLLGVDLESTTIVVSVFMFGLGFGALLGGRFGDAYPDKRILGEHGCPGHQLRELRRKVLSLGREPLPVRVP